ncbi:MAG: zinc-ribbon domain containing protein [Acidobacteria bacterium]|nr:zinc-ribbon domain containing protein [Acidobacteriota bacterium]
MEYKDQILKCAECGGDFVFTAGEQLFFARKNFRHVPKRCKGCKSKRDHVSEGGPRREETTTVCSQCGRETTVPFRPTQGRPVYCRDCFQQRRPTSSPPIPSSNPTS